MLMPQSSTSTTTIEWCACCQGTFWIDISSDVDVTYQTVNGILQLTSTEQFTMQSPGVSDTVADPAHVCAPQFQEVNLLGQCVLRHAGDMVA